MKAVCVLTNVSEPNIKGYVEFEEIEEIMKININLSGMKPGLHGFHIHNLGDLREGCGSLCSHFNPDNNIHGGPQFKINDRHAGDLGNIIVDEQGNCNQIIYDNIIKLHGKYNIIGRSVVIHEDEDDLGVGGIDIDGNIVNKIIHEESIKTGNAGKRIACGVIGWSK